MPRWRRPRRGLRSVVITFDPHPDEVVRPGTHPPLLATTRHRIELLEGLGADAVVVVPFTLELSKTPPDEFVRQVLVDRLHAAHVIVGEDFRFGHKAKGTSRCCASSARSTTSPPRACRSWPTAARSRPPTSADGSTPARWTRRRARWVAAPCGGHRRARPPAGPRAGLPTANLETAQNTAIPADGVYGGWLVCDSDRYPGFRWPAAISIGTNPTFEGAGSGPSRRTRWTATTSTCTASTGGDFTERVRDTLKFDSVEALIEQMHRDVDRIRDSTSE